MNIGFSGRRPILYDYFKKSADVLLAEYERTTEQQASANIGKTGNRFVMIFYLVFYLLALR